MINSEDLCIPPVDIEPHLLITMVRKQYLDYLFKLLRQNHSLWCNENMIYTVTIAAKKMELKAAAQAMVVPLYRQALKTMVASIKKCTEDKKPFPLLHEIHLNTQHCDKASQTDDFDTLYLHNESNHITANLRDKTDKNSNNNANFEEICNNLNDDTSNITDKIMKDMEELFKSDETEVNECDIFDDATNEIQIKVIMEEIQQYEKKSNSFFSPQTPNVNDNKEIKMNGNRVNHDGNKIEQSSLDQRLDILINVSNTNESQNYNGTVYSRWPCELYFQKKKLCEKLDDICEKSLRLHTKVKKRFIDLFGIESEDEQSLSSPDISINFTRSCRQRIAPWVARHIRPYYARKYVSTHLLKPLIKHLIYKQIEINQYPSDYEVYLFIKEYFKHHTRIKCQADF